MRKGETSKDLTPALIGKKKVEEEKKEPEKKPGFFKRLFGKKNKD